MNSPLCLCCGEREGDDRTKLCDPCWEVVNTVMNAPYSVLYYALLKREVMRVNKLKEEMDSDEGST